MHLFKLPKSIVSRSHDKHAESASTSSPSSSGSLRPLVSQPTVSSQYPAPYQDDALSLSDSSAASSFGRSFLGRKTGHRHADEHKSHQYAAPDPTGLSPPPRNSSRSVKTIYTNHPDMYTQNDLHTFSFGAAPSGQPSSSFQTIDPLLRPLDEADSDSVSNIPDTTPRPSVVGGSVHRTHPSQVSPSRPHPPERTTKAAKRPQESESDAASNFGTSSASASVSSLAPPRQSSRGTSHTSGRSTVASSSNDMTSDEETDGRHPFPHPLGKSRSNSSRQRDKESSLYLSEEDFENDNEYSDQDAMKVRSTQKDIFHYTNTGRDEFHVEQHERRGSGARDIPGVQSDRPNHPRDIYARRPSRSVEELSFSFITPSNLTFTVHDVGEKPFSISPTSVPESEGDWRDLRKRSIQRDRDSPYPSTSASSTDMKSETVTAVVSGSSVTNEFTWMQNFANGMVAFDPSEVSDFVVGTGQDGRMSLSSVRKGSSATFRRQSTVSSVDIFNKRMMGWNGTRWKSRIELWAFTREKERPEGESANTHVGDAKERSSIVAALFSQSRPSTSPSADGVSSGSKSQADGKDKDKGKDKSSGKDKQKETWKGMILDSEETWSNGTLGRFKVVRKNTISNEPGKPPQQRLNVTFIRTPYNFNSTYPPEQHLEGPIVTIHKHSKAAAFSISRHFRSRSAGYIDPSSSHRTIMSSSSQHSKIKDVNDGGRKKANTMILLATRRVQRAYTSTNTTRKLESHGLLDDSGRTSPRDIERMRREHSREERRRAKEGDKDKRKDKKDKGSVKGKERELKASESSKRRSGTKIDGPPPPAHNRSLPDSPEGSSAGSVGVGTTSGDSDTLAIKSVSSTTSPEASLTVVSQGSINSFGSVASAPSVMSQETGSSDRTVQRTIQSHVRKRGVYDDDEEDEDDDDSLDERPRHPTRTPHRETYGALPPEVFENVQQDHPSHGIFGWGRSRGGDRNGHRINHYIEAAYNPPWPTTIPRANSETRKFIVDDLNTSFQDVGLLPATSESSSHGSHKRKQRDRQQVKHSSKRAPEHHTDIFQEVPEDSVYMLLPLWPGETDPVSAKTFPYVPPVIPTERRQYLMIYYKTKALTAAETSKTQSADKKRSRESSGTTNDERTVFLTSFHISARIVSYEELQGTNVRIPDLGLAISGRMEEAYATMPSLALQRDDYVIGLCHSRENGVEFVPEGFEKLGLASHVPCRAFPEPAEDDDSLSGENVFLLTPIGRAVMEMAWLGAVAVTSFNPGL